MTQLLHRTAEFVAGRMASIVAVIGMVMVATYVTAMAALPRSSGQIVAGDAKHHFVQLRSLVFDRDLDFRNDYAAQYGISPDSPESWWLFQDPTETGLVRNYMPVGPALLWAPLYTLVATVQLVLSWMGLAARPLGYEPWLQIVPGITGVFAGAAAAWMSWRLARRFVNGPAAAVGTLSVWLGSHALYYTLVSPAYSHAASMFTASAFCLYWFRPGATLSARRAVAAGALVGLCALMRWQDALALGVPLWAVCRWQVSWTRRAAAALAATASALAVFLPQTIVWNALYGRPFAMPQGPSFMRWSDPHLFDVLFSAHHGLFSWAPLLVLAVAGLAVFAWRHREWAPAVVILTMTSWFVNAAVADWWAGEAFGARRFLSLFPLFVLGASTWMQGRPSTATARPWRMAAGLVLIVMNGLLLFQYQLFMKGLQAVAPYPSGGFDLWIARFLVPLRFVEWWLG